MCLQYYPVFSEKNAQIGGPVYLKLYYHFGH